ncbi:hypothetical protein [Oceanobacillus kapialis]|uniref:ATP-binding cassette domain-containing protein n=1 Tax=Oceanobacillus kapialis TaxID=481353 RepID=A0ABW5PWZ2_9BACI
MGKSTLLNFLLGNGQFEVLGDYHIRLPDRLSVLDQKNQLDEDYATILHQLTAKEKEAYLHLLHQLGFKRSRFADQSSIDWSAGEQKKSFFGPCLTW